MQRNLGKPLVFTSGTGGQTDQELCLNGIKRRMVDSGGDEKKLGLKQTKMPELATPGWTGDRRRILAKGTPTD